MRRPALAQITIKLRFNQRTGKKDIVIEYESDADMTGWEHEKEHKRIVENLIGKGVLEAEEFGEVIREKVKQPDSSPQETDSKETEENLEPAGA